MEPEQQMVPKKSKPVLKKKPNPTKSDAKEGLLGNLL
jgi:hypothetical protein